MKLPTFAAIVLACALAARVSASPIFSNPLFTEICDVCQSCRQTGEPCHWVCPFLSCGKSTTTTTTTASEPSPTPSQCETCITCFMSGKGFDCPSYCFEINCLAIQSPVPPPEPTAENLCETCTACILKNKGPGCPSVCYTLSDCSPSYGIVSLNPGSMNSPPPTQGIVLTPPWSVPPDTEPTPPANSFGIVPPSETPDMVSPPVVVAPPKDSFGIVFPAQSPQVEYPPLPPKNSFGIVFPAQSMNVPPAAASPPKNSFGILFPEQTAPPMVPPETMYPEPPKKPVDSIGIGFPGSDDGSSGGVMPTPPPMMSLELDPVDTDPSPPEMTEQPDPSLGLEIELERRQLQLSLNVGGGLGGSPTPENQCEVCASCKENCPSYCAYILCLAQPGQSPTRTSPVRTSPVRTSPMVSPTRTTTTTIRTSPRASPKPATKTTTTTTPATTVETPLAPLDRCEVCVSCFLSGRGFGCPWYCFNIYCPPSYIIEVNTGSSPPSSSGGNSFSIGGFGLKRRQFSIEVGSENNFGNSGSSSSGTSGGSGGSSAPAVSGSPGFNFVNGPTTTKTTTTPYAAVRSPSPSPKPVTTTTTYKRTTTTTKAPSPVPSPSAPLDECEVCVMCFINGGVDCPQYCFRIFCPPSYFMSLGGSSETPSTSGGNSFSIGGVGLKKRQFSIDFGSEGGFSSGGNGAPVPSPTLGFVNSPVRVSPIRTSPVRTSPIRTSPVRTSPRVSPTTTRTSPRVSPTTTRTSPRVSPTTTRTSPRVSPTTTRTRPVVRPTTTTRRVVPPSPIPPPMSPCEICVQCFMRGGFNCPRYCFSIYCPPSYFIVTGSDYGSDDSNSSGGNSFSIGGFGLKKRQEVSGIESENNFGSSVGEEVEEDPCEVCASCDGDDCPEYCAFTSCLAEPESTDQPASEETEEESICEMCSKCVENYIPGQRGCPPICAVVDCVPLEVEDPAPVPFDACDKCKTCEGLCPQYCALILCPA